MSARRAILREPRHRAYAKRLIDEAPVGAIVTVSEATRSLEQNAKLWAQIGDISRAQPEGRRHTAETWKCLFMHACGHETQFAMGLNGEPFPVGFRSSKLTVRQMSDLIEFIYWYGAQHGVVWSDDAMPDLPPAPPMEGTEND